MRPSGDCAGGEGGRIDPPDEAIRDGIVLAEKREEEIPPMRPSTI